MQLGAANVQPKFLSLRQLEVIMKWILKKLWEVILYLILLLLVPACKKESAEPTTSSTLTAPASPTGLQVNAISHDKITLQWLDNSDNEDGFIVERKVAPAAAFSNLATLGSNVTAFTDTGLTQNTVYGYRVAALNQKGISNYSNEAATTTQTLQSGWTLQNSGTTATLYGVWGSASNDVFVAGNNGTILHFDGSSWSTMTSGTILSLEGVWGFAANDVFIAGEDVTILHYNGSAWSKIPASHPGFLPNFHAIWGVNNNDLWAIGTGYLRMHYNGTAWSGSTNIITNNLRGVWGSSSTNVYTVGDFGTVYRHNGTSWSSDIDVVGITDLWLDFEGIWGASASEIFIVGDYDPNGTGDGDSSGTVVKYTGSQWSFLWRDSIPELRGIWGVSVNDFYVVGLKGAIAHFDGTKFTSMNSGTTQNLLKIWGNSTDVFVVGANGTILRYKR